MEHIRNLPKEALGKPNITSVEPQTHGRIRGTSYRETTAKFDAARGLVGKLLVALEGSPEDRRGLEEILEYKQSEVNRLRSERGRDLKKAGKKIRSEILYDLPFPTVVFKAEAYSNN